MNEFILRGGRGCAALLAVVSLGGCATQDYVDKAVANVQGQVTADKARIDAQGSRLDAIDAHLAKLDGDTQGAMRRADEAAALAAGRFNTTKLGEVSVLFKTGSWRLSGEAATTLSDLAGRLKSDNKNVYLEIEGFADSQGASPYNKRLGAERALAVFANLAGQGVPLNRMEEISHGEANPVASNATRGGRSQNRRVVISIVQ